MGETGQPDGLLAAVDAYAAQMGEGTAECAFCDGVADEGGRRGALDAAMVAAAAAPHARRLAPPPPGPASPAALYARLLRELDFPEGPALLTALEKINEDVFGALPVNAHLYADAKLLSVAPEEVLSAAESEAEEPAARGEGPVDLNAHGDAPLPALPADEGGLADYVDAVQAFFVSELEARERAYLRLFLGYCRALALYIKRAATAPAARGRPSRGAGRGDAEGDARTRARRALAARYYRDAARLAKVLYLHLYLSVARETSSRLRAVQRTRQELFVYLRYEWTMQRQFWCLFHPLLFNHGVVVIEGRAARPADLRGLNHVRRELGLPPVRCGLLEEPGAPPDEPPPFSGAAPRASSYLLQCIRSKMEHYSRVHPRHGTASAIDADHSYARPFPGAAGPPGPLDIDGGRCYDDYEDAPGGVERGAAAADYRREDAGGHEVAVTVFELGGGEDDDAHPLSFGERMGRRLPALAGDAAAVGAV